MLILFSYNIILPIVILLTIVAIIVFVYRADNTSGKTEPFSEPQKNTESRNTSQVSKTRYDTKNPTKIREKAQHPKKNDTLENVSEGKDIRSPVSNNESSSKYDGKFIERDSQKDENAQHEDSFENTNNTLTPFHEADMLNEKRKSFSEDENTTKRNDSTYDNTTCEMKNEDLFYNGNNNKNGNEKSNHDLQFCNKNAVNYPLRSSLNSIDTVNTSNDVGLKGKENAKNNLIKSNKGTLTDEYNKHISPNGLSNKHRSLSSIRRKRKELRLKENSDEKSHHLNTLSFNDKKMSNLFGTDCNKNPDNVNRHNLSNDIGSLSTINTTKHLTSSGASSGSPQPDNLASSGASSGSPRPDNMTSSGASSGSPQPDNMTSTSASSGSLQPDNMTSSGASSGSPQPDNMTSSGASSRSPHSDDLRNSSKKQGSPHSDENIFNTVKPTPKSVVKPGPTSIPEKPDIKTQTNNPNKGDPQGLKKTGMNDYPPSSKPHPHSLSGSGKFSVNSNISGISYTPKRDLIVQNTLDIYTNAIEKTTDQIRSLFRNRSYPDLFDKLPKEKTQEEPLRFKTSEEDKSFILNSPTEKNNKFHTPISHKKSNNKTKVTGEFDNTFNSLPSFDDELYLGAYEDLFEEFDSSSSSYFWDSFIGKMKPEYSSSQFEYDNYEEKGDFEDLNYSLDSEVSELDFDFDDNITLFDFNSLDSLIEDNDYKTWESDGTTRLENSKSDQNNYYKKISRNPDKDDTRNSKLNNGSKDTINVFSSKPAVSKKKSENNQETKVSTTSGNPNDTKNANTDSNKNSIIKDTLPGDTKKNNTSSMAEDTGDDSWEDQDSSTSGRDESHKQTTDKKFTGQKPDASRNSKVNNKVRNKTQSNKHKLSEGDDIKRNKLLIESQALIKGDINTKTPIDNKTITKENSDINKETKTNDKKTREDDSIKKKKSKGFFARLKAIADKTVHKIEDKVKEAYQKTLHNSRSIKKKVSNHSFPKKKTTIGGSKNKSFFPKKILRKNTNQLKTKVKK